MWVSWASLEIDVCARPPRCSSQQPAWTSIIFLFVWIVCLGPQGASVSHPPNGGSVRQTASGDHWILLHHVGDRSYRDPIMSNGRDPQSSFLHCNIKGKWSGMERREERDGDKHVENRKEREGWSQRREEKLDLLLLGLFICWGQHSEPTGTLKAGIATTVRGIPVWKPTG